MEHLRVDANGMTFGALAWGDPKGPLALLVHGYPDTAHSWRHLGPAVAAAGWRAVAPFTRGYGPSDLAPDDRYFIADQARDLCALHVALGGDDRAVLVGHDWGAVAAWAVLDSEPDRFARCVCLAVPPPAAILKPYVSPRSLPLAPRQLRMSWYFLFNQLPGLSERSLDRVIPKLWRDWSPGYDGREDVAHVLEALRGPGRRRAALRYYRDNLTAGLKATFTITPRAPALYLHGDRDGCMQVAIADRHQETLPPGGRYERVAGVGHFMHLEEPDRVNATIMDWIGAPR